MAPLPPFGPWKRKCYQMTDQVLGMGGWVKYKKYLEDYICGNISKVEFDKWLNENIGNEFMYIHNAYIVEMLQDIKEGKANDAEQINNNVESSSSSSSSSSNNNVNDSCTREEYIKVVDFLRSSSSADLRTVASILDMADGDSCSSAELRTGASILDMADGDSEGEEDGEGEKKEEVLHGKIDDDDDVKVEKTEKRPAARGRKRIKR